MVVTINNKNNTNNTAVVWILGQLNSEILQNEIVTIEIYTSTIKNQRACSDCQQLIVGGSEVRDYSLDRKQQK